MPLDLEPVEEPKAPDLEPAGQGGDLELQPAEEPAKEGLDLQPAEGLTPLPEGFRLPLSPYDKARLTIREPMGPWGPIDPSEGARTFVATWGGVKPIVDVLDLAARPVTQTAREAVSKVLESWGIPPPSTDQPFFELPRTTPEQMAQMPKPVQVVSGLANLASGVAQSLGQPENLVLLPAMAGEGAVARAAALVFGSEQFAALPDQVQNAVRTLQDPNATLGEKVEALGQPGVSGLLGTVMVRQGIRPGTEAAVGTEGPTERTGTAPGGAPGGRRSEFGGEASRLDLEPAGTTEKGAEHAKQNVRAAQSDVDVLNTERTGGGAREVPADEGGAGVPPRGQGEDLRPPAPSARAEDVSHVISRTEPGAALSAPEPAGKAPEAARAETPAAGAVQGIETGASSSTAPLTLLKQTIWELSRERAPIPRSVVEQFNATSDHPLAMPEGYSLEGEQYVWREAAERLTPEQRQAREAAHAMAELRAEKEATGLDLDPLETRAPEDPGPPAESMTAEDFSSAEPRTKPPPVEAGTPGVFLGERPPDILDWIGDNFRRGVRFGSAADYGDMLSRARGRAKDLMSLTRGEAADEVIKEMHDQGLWRRIESLDDLAQAMVNAGEARFGVRAQAKTLRGWEAAAAKLDSLKMNTAGQLHAFGLAPAAWNALIDLVKVGLRAGKAVKDAVDWGLRAVAHEGFEHEPARQFLLDWFDRNGEGRYRGAREGKGATIQRRQQSGTAAERIAAAARIAREPSTAAERTTSALRRAAAAAEIQGQIVRDFPRRPNGGLDWRKASPEQVQDFFDAERFHSDALQAVRDEANRSTIDYPPHGEFLRGINAQDEALLRDRLKVWPSELQRATGGGPANAIEAWLNGLKMQTSGQLHAFGLVPELWNTLVDLVKLGVRAGRAVGDAVDWAIGRFKELHPDRTFDDAGARAHLLSAYGERQTGQKVLESERFSQETKQAASNYLYQRRTLGNDQATADGLLQHLGLDGALQAWRDPPAGMPEMVRSRLAGSIGKALQDAETAATKAGDLEGARRLQERAGRFLDEVMERSTELAQGLKGLDMLAMFSPDAVVARTRQAMDRAADERLAQHGAELETLRTALEQGRQEGLEAVRQDPQANGAARAAVDETVAHSAETHKAVVMEMAEPWASSTEVMRLARMQVRAKANELLNRRPQPPGLTPAAHLRAILDDLAQRAAGIAAGHFQGAEPLKTLARKLQERLGLAKDRAEGLAGQLEREWTRQVAQAKARLPQRIANARVARERAAGTLESTSSQIDAAIHRQLRALNLRLGDVLRSEAEAQGHTEAHVAERIVQASGLTGEAADTFRTVLKQRWDALVTGAQTRALEALQRRSGVTVTRPFRSAFERLTQLDRLGALTSERFHGAVKDALKLKRLEPADAAELRRMVGKAQSLPEGFLRQREGVRVEQFISKLKGEMRWWDVPMGVFYANILSGLTTPAKIVFENTNLLVGHTLTALLSRPGELLHPADFARAVGQAYGRGLIKGGLQAADTLRSGIVSGVWERPKPSGVMESKPFGARLEPLNFWKWFTRAIAVTHETTFKPAWEVKQTLMARELARREGLRGAALQQRVADLLGDTPATTAAARGQALRELGPQADKLDLARRTREIIEQERERTMPGTTAAARDFALRTAYLNEPYGFLGLIANGIRTTLEQARKRYPAIGTGVKAQIPFTTIVANILNEKLNWTPAGLLRAAVSHRTGELYGRKILSEGERTELYAKAITGTVALGALGALFGDHIHGNGPGAPQKRKQLQATGWIPHSIELNGRYYSYMNTPAAVGLAVLGNWLDWHRYGKGEAADGAARASFALKATANAIVSQGMLDSVKRIFEALGDESTTEGAAKLEKALARTGSSFVVPNLMQQLDRIWDPTVYDQTGMQALVKGQIPFVRRENKPVLSVLGDPIQSGPFHYWSSKVSRDELLRALAEKQAWVPEPSRNQIVGDKARGEDHYRAMTPDEYYDFIAESGPRIRDRLEKSLGQLELMEPDKAKAFVAKVAEEEHGKAKRAFRP